LQHLRQQQQQQDRFPTFTSVTPSKGLTFGLEEAGLASRTSKATVWGSWLLLTGLTCTAEDI
jgi:hypothetical protein